MSKERLEEIKNRRKNYRPDLLPIWFEDMDYLIERVQELEEQHRDEFEKVNFLFKRNNERRNKINDLEQQNKRYREALEFYADEGNYKTTGGKFYIGHGDFTEEAWIPVDIDNGKIARKELESESE